jgi:hypothetical protein
MSELPTWGDNQSNPAMDHIASGDGDRIDRAIVALEATFKEFMNVLDDVDKLKTSMAIAIREMSSALAHLAALRKAGVE